MKQKLIKLLTVITVLLSGNIVWAYDFESGGIYYNITSNENKTVEVTYKDSCYNSYTGEIIIPASVTNGETAYKVSSIGEGAFSRCTGLCFISIPDSVTSIGEGAFFKCTDLLSITIPKAVTSIGFAAFWYCSGLTSVTIPSLVTSIGVGAFSNCNSLISIIVESENAKYDSRDNCNAIIETATNTLIQGCQNTIIPNTVTSLGDYAFDGCSGLTSIIIPNSVTSIGLGTFSSCKSLTSITIPNSVTSIGEEAFSNCNLTSITIPNSVISIGDRAFDFCFLDNIYCKAATPPTYNGLFEEPVLQYATLYVPKGCKEAYESVEPWKLFLNIQEMEFSNVESALSDNVNVSVENGNIVISGTENINVEVFSIKGQCVYRGEATTISIVAKGLYIVKVKDKSFKVML